MVLVGLGMDLSAQRIVAYLAERGIDISLVTFHGYSHAESMLLAKHEQTVEESLPGHHSPSLNELNRRAIEYEVEQVWKDARKALDRSNRVRYTKSGITYQQRRITLPDGSSVRGSHSIAIGEPKRIRITFYPAAVELCGEQFEALKKEIKFEAEKPPNAPATQNSPDQWYCSLDEASWNLGKGRLIEFVKHLESVWRDHEHLYSDGTEETNGNTSDT